MQIESADSVLLDIREQLRASLPGVIDTLNAERTDFAIQQIAPQYILLNVEEAVNASQFIVLSGALTNPKNAGSNQKASLLLDIFVGFVPNAYATKDQAVCASFRYHAALMESFRKMNLPFGNIHFAGAEPPGSMRMGNKALYGALVQYDIQLF